MACHISDLELEKKTVQELKEMLSDDDLNGDEILRITEVIIKAENKSNEQRETERVAFWARLLVNKGNKIPIHLDEVIKDSNEANKNPENSSRKYYELFSIKLSRRIVAVILILLVFIMGNTVSAYAFNFSIFNVIVEFTDTIFNTKFIPLDNPKENLSNDITDDMDSNIYDSFQDALDVYDITDVTAPTWLPENYVYNSVETIDTSERDIIIAMYKNEESVISITILKYHKISDFQTRTFEKSKGNPIIFSHNGIDHYIFSNKDKTVSTWIIEMNEYDIQGNISLEEIKSIIKSMYKE